MAGEWIATDFADAIDFQEGPGILAKDFHDHGVPLVRLSGLDRGASLLAGCNYLDPDLVAKKWAHFALKKGDILLSTSASLGRIAVVDDEGVGAIAYTGLIRMRPRDERLVAPFIRYLLEGPSFQQQAEAFGAGSVIRHFGPMHLRQMNVLLPPPPEQRAIAHILGTLDDKIELNRRRNQTLEAMAHALYKDWFIDFGPVRAKMEGREPYLPADLWQLFPDRFDDEGKPEGWAERTLGDFVDIYDSRRVPLSGKQRAERQGPYPYHGAAGVMDGVDDFLFDGVHVLLGEDGSVAKPDGRPFTQYVWGKFWVNNHAHVLKGRGISNETLLVFLDQCDVAPFVTGAVQPKLSQGNLKAIPFIDAGDNLLRQFGDVIGPLFAQIRDATEESRTLAQLRDTLLPKLISGELRISDAETFLERVT
jgi:type I restriction enzyme S subunit